MAKQIEFNIQIADDRHIIYAQEICEEMEASARARGTGIAKRAPEYLIRKMEEGKAVIAFTKEGIWAGFCYIETWSHGKYVANSGLVVGAAHRNSGLGKRIKERIFELSMEKYPEAKIFGLTTGLAVMKINSELGYKPVTYSELTDDQMFWEGCKSCVNFEILNSKERKNCLCTAMLYDPEKQKRGKDSQKNLSEFKSQMKIYERWMKIKQKVMLQGVTQNDENKNEEPNRKKKLVSLFNMFIGV
jgi:hypothetical protein